MQKTLLWHEDDPFHLAILEPDDPAYVVHVAGVSFRQEPLAAFRNRFRRAPRLVAWLWPEPSNPHDSRAIRVMLLEPFSKDTVHVGYVPKDLTGSWCPAVNDFLETTGFFPAFPAVVIGGREGRPTFGVIVMATDALKDWFTQWEKAA